MILIQFDGCIRQLKRTVDHVTEQAGVTTTMWVRVDWGYLRIADGSDYEESDCNVGDLGLIPGSGRFPWRRKWQPTPVFLPRKFHGQRNLVGYKSMGSKRVGHN